MADSTASDPQYVYRSSDAAYPRAIRQEQPGGVTVSGNRDQGLPVRFYRWRAAPMELKRDWR